MKNLLACILLLTTTVSFGQHVEIVENYSFNDGTRMYDYMKVYKLLSDKTIDWDSGKTVSLPGKRVSVPAVGNLFGVQYFNFRGGLSYFDSVINAPVEVHHNVDGSEDYIFTVIDKSNNEWTIVLAKYHVTIASFSTNTCYIIKNTPKIH